MQPWLTVEELRAAIDAVRAAAGSDGELQPLEATRLKPVRQLLLEQPETARKVISQEQACPQGVALSLTYNQIRLAIADRIQGLNLETAAQDLPPPMSELLASSGQPSQPPW